jgi:iron complex transport system substrate-binding protein
LDPEFPIKENPSFITYEDVLSRDTIPLIGYGQADSSRIEKVIEEIKALPGFNMIVAVKNNRVYAIPYALESHCIWLAALYQAKLFHPELFADLDVPAIHQEYLEKFMGLGPDVYKNSIFIYPSMKEE